MGALCDVCDSTVHSGPNICMSRCMYDIDGKAVVLERGEFLEHDAAGGTCVRTSECAAIWVPCRCMGGIYPVASCCIIIV